MATLPGQYSRALDTPHISRRIYNLLRYGTFSSQNSSGTGGGTGEIITSQFRTIRRTVLFYASGGAVLSLDATSTEYYDKIAKAWTSEYLRIPPQLGFPFPGTFQLRKSGVTWPTGPAEAGSVEIVGLDVSGSPSYFTIATAQIPAGEASIDGDNAPLLMAWSYDAGNFRVWRIHEKAALESHREFVFRVKIYRDMTGTPPFGGALFAQPIDNRSGSTITDGATPTSAASANIYTGTLGNVRFRGMFDIGASYGPRDVAFYGGIAYKSKSTQSGHTPPNATYWDVWPGPGPEMMESGWNDPASANYALPLLNALDVAGPQTVLEISVPAGFEIVETEAGPWNYALEATIPGDRVYLNWNPQDQLDSAGAPDVTKTTIRFSMIDFQAQTATVNVAGNLGNTAAPVVFTANFPYFRISQLRNGDEIRLWIRIVTKPTGDTIGR